MPAQVSVEDELAARRLTGLLDYVEALVKLDERVATRLSQHKFADGSQFALHQHEIAGLPAIQCDSTDADGPIWLRVQRLQRTTPPAFGGAGKEWIDVSNDPLRVASSEAAPSNSGNPQCRKERVRYDGVWRQKPSTFF